MKLVQTFLLSIIAFGVIGILAQNQIIIGKLSQEKPENSFTKQASFKPNQNFVALPVNSDGSIDVNIKSSNNVMDVNIESCESYALQYAFGSYPLSVKIKD